MTATVFRQSYMTQHPSLFTLISYCAIVFSFALIFADGWFTACDGFYGASACWLSHMKQLTITNIYYFSGWLTYAVFCAKGLVPQVPQRLWKCFELMTLRVTKSFCGCICVLLYLHYAGFSKTIRHLSSCLELMSRLNVLLIIANSENALKISLLWKCQVTYKWNPLNSKQIQCWKRNLMNFLQSLVLLVSLIPGYSCSRVLLPVVRHFVPVVPQKMLKINLC